jgi:hypothetical protein
MQRASVQYALVGWQRVFAAALLAGDADLCKTSALCYEAIFDDATAIDAQRRREYAAYFIRPDLLFPECSPWAAIREAGNDGAFITFLRVDVSTFHALLANADTDELAWLEGYTDGTRTARRPGRPNMNDGAAHLAMALTFLSTRCSLKHLELFFGTGHSVTQRDVNKGLGLLEGSLKALDKESGVYWPSAKEQVAWADAMEGTYGACPIDGVRPFCLVDGLRLPVATPSDVEAQAELYNRYSRGVTTLQVLAYGPNGKIIDAALNLPGRYNDYKGARHFFSHLLDPALTLPGYVAIGDGAFASLDTNRHVATEHFEPPMPVSGPQRRAFESWRLHIRKGAEWGMATFCNTWRRLSVPLPTCMHARFFLLAIAVRMHNLIAHRMHGRNQLRTVYLEAFLNA